MKALHVVVPVCVAVVAVVVAVVAVWVIVVVELSAHVGTAEDHVMSWDVAVPHESATLSRRLSHCPDWPSQVERYSTFTVSMKRFDEPRVL